jgi:ferredoxin
VIARLDLLDSATVAVGSLVFLALVWAAVVSYREREPRAVAVALLLGLLAPLPYLIVGLSTFSLQTAFEIVLLSATGLTLFLLFVPAGNRPVIGDDTPTTRIDERDIMFSRNLLLEGEDRFEEYYAANPEKRALDDAFRAKPGFLGRKATAYNAYHFASTDASFWTIEQLRPHVEGRPARKRVESDPEAITLYIKGWVHKLGAESVGVTELRDYHKYSVIGRGTKYGRPVELNHDYAIALTVEMTKAMVDRAPLGPTAMESAQQYVDSGVIAVQVAQFIRLLGYHARAHIDGNYRVVCPLVARDAGLGELGRMGLLMTPELGPRVRLAVVTTDLPLVVDERVPDHSMVDFCTHCKKCAEVCPSEAIRFDDRREVDGVRRWQINQEACFTLWCEVGTDCARCMSACPYSHPDNALHRLVRFGVRRNGLFRRLAIKGDDLFYGRKRPPARLAGWLKIEEAAGPQDAGGKNGHDESSRR